MNIEQLEKYCDRRGIIAATYQKAAELIKKNDFLETSSTRGMAIHVEKYESDLILYDGNLPDDEKFHVFAHEIGHHVMKHLTSRHGKANGAELEADVFASVLMALSVFAEVNQAI